jgi:hypothetical protein
VLFFRRRLLLLCLLSLSCEGGPTSDWPAKGNGGDDDNPQQGPADAGVASMRDASAAMIDAGKPETESSDAGDAGDAGTPDQ